jgi:FAD:protein FMN transferase
MRFWTICLLSMGMLCGCRTAAPPSTWQRFEYAELHMACMVRVVFYAPDQATADGAAVAAYRRIAELENIMSDYDPNSELSRLSHEPPGADVKISPDLFAVLKAAGQVSERSQGAFDVTVGPLVRLWRAARKTHELPSAEEIQSAQARSGWQKLQLDDRHRTARLLVAGMQLDLGGIGKGYAADAALRVLRSHGIKSAMIAVSGDIALGNPPPGKAGWRIAIDPLGGQTNAVERIALLSRCGVSTSGDVEQYIEIGGVRYSHIVNPKTGLGLTHRIAVTIIAPCATWSDAYTKTISVMGVEPGLKLINSQRNFAAQVLTLDDTGRHFFYTRHFPPAEPNTAPVSSPK